MKKALSIIIGCTLLFSACLKHSSDSVDGGNDATVVIVDKYSNTKDFQVEVKGDGTITQVIYHRADGDQEILATTDMPLTIQIPAWIEGNSIVRSAAAPAPGDEYLEIREYAKGTLDFEANSYIKDGTSVLMFEDSRTGDFDYNDLVLYVSHSITGNGISKPGAITFRIKPIALGSANKIGFGWEDGNGEHMFTDDVRRDFFFNEQGFINTYDGVGGTPDKPRYDAIPVVTDGSGNTVCEGYTIVRDRDLMVRARYDDAQLDEIVGGYFQYDPMPTTCTTTSSDTKMIKYFIKTSGFKFYVSSIDKGAPEGTYPYGIAIPNAAYHARETVAIWEAYPDFKSWILTGSPVNWSGNRVKANCYEKHVNYARW